MYLTQADVFYKKRTAKPTEGEYTLYSYSFCSLSYNRSVASSKASPPQCAI
jgi:hypothetical protein